jgi:polysaccharide export outer membrane protein
MNSLFSTFPSLRESRREFSMGRAFLFLFLSFFLLSCSNYKDLPYFQNAKDFKDDGTVGLYDITIKPKDQLAIFVFSGTNPDAVRQFRIIEPSAMDYTQERISVRGSSQTHPYIVENDGNIDYPLVGKIHLEGLTIEQANQHIKEKIAPYIQEGVDYIVNTYLQNYDVTVMGEVKKPNTFNTGRNKMTILEALAQAGDMTIYGKRDKVKVLRELPDGTYEVHELDLRDANILNSPYYYLQQRDIVYVEPNEAMAQNSQVGTTTRLWVRGVAITISLGSLLYRVLN